jgi:hypothetical protein
VSDVTVALVVLPVVVLILVFGFTMIVCAIRARRQDLPRLLELCMDTFVRCCATLGLPLRREFPPITTRASQPDGTPTEEGDRSEA